VPNPNSQKYFIFLSLHQKLVAKVSTLFSTQTNLFTTSADKEGMHAAAEL
jgi:hypothetical protein